MSEINPGMMACVQGHEYIASNDPHYQIASAAPACSTDVGPATLLPRRTLLQTPANPMAPWYCSNPGIEVLGQLRHALVSAAAAAERSSCAKLLSASSLPTTAAGAAAAVAAAADCTCKHRSTVVKQGLSVIHRQP
jgi:hypothetical protein